MSRSIDLLKEAERRLEAAVQARDEAVKAASEAKAELTAWQRRAEAAEGCLALINDGIVDPADGQAKAAEFVETELEIPVQITATRNGMGAVTQLGVTEAATKTASAGGSDAGPTLGQQISNEPEFQELFEELFGQTA